jgi:hypothetical protein
MLEMALGYESEVGRCVFMMNNAHKNSHVSVPSNLNKLVSNVGLGNMY